MKMLWTAEVFIYLYSILLIRIIKTKDGRTKAKVAMALPSTAIMPLMPALWTAV